jgi:hypothetical protein
MACTIGIQLDAANATVDGKFDWKNALKATALEFEKVINPVLAAVGKEQIKVNSEAALAEDFLGNGNTPPTTSDDWEYNGLLEVKINNYDFINSRFFDILSAQVGSKVPTTFWLCSNVPPQSGVIA